jgi:hypothetical protein
MRLEFVHTREQPCKWRACWHVSTLQLRLKPDRHTQTTQLEVIGPETRQSLHGLLVSLTAGLDPDGCLRSHALCGCAWAISPLATWTPLLHRKVRKTAYPATDEILRWPGDFVALELQLIQLCYSDNVLLRVS